MTTRQITENYLAGVKEKSNWQVFIADTIRFASPGGATIGKDEYVIAASRFFQMVETLEIKQLVTEGECACAWIDYRLRKNGKAFICTVSELLQIQDDQIISSTILFDTFALKAFTSAN